MFLKNCKKKKLKFSLKKKSKFYFSSPKGKIKSIKKSTRQNKKYVAKVENTDGSIKTIHFGDNRYEQYRDSTPLKLYSNKNHGDKKRRSSYFKRHSGTENKSEAIKKEFKKSNGNYNAKILSHKYLW